MEGFRLNLKRIVPCFWRTEVSLQTTKIGGQFQVQRFLLSCQSTLSGIFESRTFELEREGFKDFFTELDMGFLG